MLKINGERKRAASSRALLLSFTELFIGLSIISIVNALVNDEDIDISLMEYKVQSSGRERYAEQRMAAWRLRK